MLAAALKNQLIEIKQCDVDVVIVQTVFDLSQRGYSIIVTHDIDVLVLMIAHLPDELVFLIKPPIGKRRYFHP